MTYDSERARKMANGIPYEAKATYYLWNHKKGGVCADAAGILDCFLRKMQIDTCVGHISRNDHPTNWAMLDGQAYELDATFWDGTELDKDPTIKKINTPKPDDGINGWRYPTE